MDPNKYSKTKEDNRNFSGEEEALRKNPIGNLAKSDHGWEGTYISGNLVRYGHGGGGGEFLPLSPPPASHYKLLQRQLPELGFSNIKCNKTECFDALTLCLPVVNTCVDERLVSATTFCTQLDLHNTMWMLKHFRILPHSAFQCIIFHKYIIMTVMSWECPNFTSHFFECHLMNVVFRRKFSFRIGNSFLQTTVIYEREKCGRFRSNGAI